MVLEYLTDPKGLPQAVSSGSSPTFAADLGGLATYFGAGRTFRKAATQAALISLTGMEDGDMALVATIPAPFRYDGSSGLWKMFGVARFSSSSARASAITSPQSGMLTYREDAGVFEVYTGAAWVVVAGRTTYAFRAAANLSSGSALQALDFATPTGADFTESTGVFTCAVAGTYRIVLSVTFAANSTSLRGAGLLYSNGSVTHATIIPAQSSTVPQTVTLTWLLTVAVGETVTAQALQVSGGNLLTSAEILFERVA